MVEPAEKVLFAWQNRALVEDFTEDTVVFSADSNLSQRLKTARQIRDQLVALRLCQTNLVGYKVGLTSAVSQQTMGVDSPEYGSLLADMHLPTVATIANNCPQPYKLEPEIAFKIAEDLPILSSIQWQQLDFVDLSQLLVSHLAGYTVATDIINTRFSGQPKIENIVSENLMSGYYQTADFQTPNPKVEEWSKLELLVTVNNQQQVVSAASCMGNPIHAVLWLWRTLNHQQSTLQAEQVILSGSLCLPVELKAGHQVSVSHPDLGQLSLKVSVS